MIIRPNYIKAIIPFLIAISLWVAALIMPPRPSLLIIGLGIILPSIIPLGILFTLINTKIFLSNDGFLTYKIIGFKKHMFKREDVISIKEDYLFRNIKGGLGFGKATYINYFDITSKIEKVLTLSSIYSVQDIKSIKNFLAK